jgi:hypothetical protein
MISHSESSDPGVTPPLTIDQRKRPSRQSRKASSTRRSTSSRVPNTNRRSAGLIGVEIKCLALISAISDGLGNRLLWSATGPPRATAETGIYDAVRQPSREVTFHFA